MNPALQSFMAVALPIMVTVLVAAWLNSHGFTGVHKRLDDIVSRLDRIEKKQNDHEGRIVRVEERTSLFGSGR